MPYLLPILITCAVISLILHLAASSLNKQDKIEEFSWKRKDFYSDLQALKTEDNPSNAFIDKLMSSCKTWYLFYTAVPESELDNEQYKDSYVYTKERKLYFIDKEGSSQHLDIHQEARQVFDESLKEILGGLFFKELHYQDIKKLIKAHTGYKPETQRFTVDELDRVGEDKYLAHSLKKHLNVLPFELRKTIAARHCLDQLSLLLNHGTILEKLSLEIQAQLAKPPKKESLIKRTANFFYKSEIEKNLIEEWLSLLPEDEDSLKALKEISKEYPSLMPSQFLSALEQKDAFLHQPISYQLHT